MKLSVLLVTLLALSWAFAEDLKDDETFSEQKDDNDLQAEVGDEVLKTRMARAFKFTSNGKLQWVWYRGSMPKYAVRFWNHYRRRYEYPCLGQCVPGFAIHGKHACHVPYGGKEHKLKHFQILVNKNNSVKLQWKLSGFGSVPSNAVKSSCGTAYVGKNMYGLGKIDPRNKSFYLGWNGKEHWYHIYFALTARA